MIVYIVLDGDDRIVGSSDTLIGAQNVADPLEYNYYLTIYKIMVGESEGGEMVSYIKWDSDQYYKWLIGSREGPLDWGWT